MGDQLRGDKLKSAIRKGLQELYAQAGPSYVYNATELARHVGTSRMSRNRHRDFIDEVLDELKAERRTGAGQAMLQHLREKIERLEAENETLKRELQALYQHHADIYSQMYNYSINMAKLMKPILDQEIYQAGKCLLCGQAISIPPVRTKSSNVVGISKRDSKKEQEKLPARE